MPESDKSYTEPLSANADNEKYNPASVIYDPLGSGLRDLKDLEKKKFNVSNVLYDPARDGGRKAAEPAAAAPIEEAPAETAPTEEVPAEDVPVEETPAETVVEEEIPAETASAEPAPARTAESGLDPHALVSDYVDLDHLHVEGENEPQEDDLDAAIARAEEACAAEAAREEAAAGQEAVDEAEGIQADDAIFDDHPTDEDVARTVNEAQEAADRHEAIHGEDDFVRDIRSAIREGQEEDDQETAAEKAGKSAVKNIRKPRFISKDKPAPQTEESHQDQLAPEKAAQTQEPEAAPDQVQPEPAQAQEEDQPPRKHRLSLFGRGKDKDKTTDDHSDILAAEEDQASVKRQKAEKAAAEDELAQARAAQKRAPSICQGLADLEKQLEEGKSPAFHKNEVLVDREKTLALIRSLTNICNADPAYIDYAEDALVDVLVTDDGAEDTYKPLERARKRARTIITNAQSQADDIIRDARVLSGQLLAETESEIKSRYDEADQAISVRMTTAKEESSKKLNEARGRLTSSRQRSVEILNKYMEKAESDYEGYWTRAEHTVIGALRQSDQILAKAEKIYGKELEFIRQDKEELEDILERLQNYRGNK
jgi:hypothetical protein